MKQVKKTLLYIILLISTICFSQIQINLNLDPNINPKLSEWENQPELMMLTIINTGNDYVGLKYKIDGKLYKDDEVIASTIFSKMPILELPEGTEILYADDIIPINAINRNSDIEKTLIKTGSLPAGNYRLCVRLVNLDQEQISTPEEVCGTTLITGYQYPELISPINDYVVDKNALIITNFEWTPLTPQPKSFEGIKYKVVISEILEGQNPQQAFMVNTPIIEREVLQNTQFLWPAEIPEPEEDKRYVWSVSPLSLEDQPFKTDKSPFVKIGTFQVKDTSVSPEPETQELDTIYAGKNNEFAIVVEDKTVTNNKITGNGKVKIPWLNAYVEVNFKDIIVNAQNQLTTGKIITKIDETAPVYPKKWAINQAASYWTNSKAGNLHSWLDNKAGNKLKYKTVQEKATPLNLPIGVTFKELDKLVISEMIFEPNESKLAVVTVVDTPSSFNLNNQKIAFETSNLLFRKNDISFGNAKLELIEDLRLPNINNKITFVLKKKNGNRSGCNVTFKEGGFDAFSLDLDAEFTRDWFVPTNGTQKTIARLTGNGDSWSDIMLSGNFPKSKIVFMDNTTLKINQLYYDMSDVRNPSGIKFPENYSGDKNEMFRGFYAKAFEVQLPPSFKVHNSGSLIVSANNIIINETGVTCKAKATNIVQYPQGNLADLTASVDEINIDILNNTLQNGSLKGKVALPITNPSTNQNNLLEYNSVLHLAQKQNDTTKVMVTIQPKKGIKADLFKGKLDIDNTSTITASADKFSKKFDIDLNGKMVWKQINLGKIKQVDLGMKFSNVGLNYNSAEQNDKLKFSSGSWAFASPQKKLSGFPVTIENVGFTNKTSKGNELVRKALKLDVVFNMTEDIGGSTTLEVIGAIEKNADKFKPKYVETNLKTIKIAADLAAVKVNGQVDIRNDDPVYGNGFLGQLEATFKAAGIKATATAEFGNTTYQSSSKYRYWRVEADATMPAPGIPFITGLAFRGFGGGAYKNMSANYNQLSNKYTFTPKKSSLGFKAKAIIATTPKEEAFNADVSLGAQFSSSQGLTQVSFGGDFYTGANLTTASRKKAMLKGRVNVNYNVPEKHFNLTTTAEFKAPPVSTIGAASMSLDVKGRTGKWYFKFGEPTNLNRVRVYGIPLYSYLMFGNDIQAPRRGFTDNFINKYRRATGKSLYRPSAATGVDANSAMGKGLALGIGLEFEVNKNVKLFSNAGVNLGIDVGSEINMSLLEYSGRDCTNSSRRIGFNGWRAKGNMGYYLKSSVSAYYGKRRWNLAHIKSDGYLTAEFPNPTYSRGRIAGHIKVGCLWNGCLINKSFNKSFKYGRNCSGGSVDSGITNIAQEDKAEDYLTSLITSISPARLVNADPRSNAKVQFSMALNKPFEVTEQQSNGSFKVRTFRLTATTEFEYYDDKNNRFKNVNTQKSLEANNTRMLLSDRLPNKMSTQQITQQATSYYNNSTYSASTVTYSTMPVATLSYVGNDASATTQTYNYGTTQTQNNSTTSSSQDLKLAPDTLYTLKVSAKMQEIVNGRWQDLKTKNGRSLKRVKTTIFRTKKLTEI